MQFVFIFLGFLFSLLFSNISFAEDEVPVRDPLCERALRGSHMAIIPSAQGDTSLPGILYRAITQVSRLVIPKPEDILMVQLIDNDFAIRCTKRTDAPLFPEYSCAIEMMQGALTPGVFEVRCNVRQRPDCAVKKLFDGLYAIDHLPKKPEPKPDVILVTGEVGGGAALLTTLVEPRTLIGIIRGARSEYTLEMGGLNFEAPRPPPAKGACAD